VPFVRGRILAETELAGPAKRFLDVLLWMDSVASRDLKALDELEILRTYLEWVTPFVCRIRLWVPNKQASRAKTQRRNAIAQWEWKNKEGQSLSAEMYEREIQPRLSTVSISAIATALGVSWSYAADIRRGKRRPPQRHWEMLTELVCAQPTP